MHDTTAEQRDQQGKGAEEVTQEMKTMALAPRAAISTSPAVATPPQPLEPPVGYAPSDVEQVWEQLRAKDAQILMLQKRLSHFRAWVSSIHQRISSVNPHAIKNSRRLYVGGVPPETQDDELRQFFNSLMIQSGALISPGSAILSCKITSEKSYAFVEFRSVEEASNAMAFDGVAFKEVYLKIRRPSNYDHNTALMLGPTYPDPTMDTSGLDICRTIVEDSPHKLFVGGLPCDWSEDGVKELLAPYGNLKSFNLVMDKVTGKSKGYAFCEYADDTVTDYAIRNLNGRKLGQKMLTVKRALEGGRIGGRGPMLPPMQMQAINTRGPAPGYGQGHPVPYHHHHQQGGGSYGHAPPAPQSGGAGAGGSTNQQYSGGNVTPTSHTGGGNSPYAPQATSHAAAAAPGGSSSQQGGSGPAGSAGSSQQMSHPFGVAPSAIGGGNVMSGINNLW